VIATGANAFVRVMLTPGCAACGAPLDAPLRHPVCASCWASIAPIHPPACVRCGEPLVATADAGPECDRCLARPPSFDVARAAGRYDAALREVVHVFKFEGRRALAGPLAALMRDAGHELLAGADAVVPVPLHPWRALGRGFNQADDLASALGLPVWRALRRTGAGPPQSALPAGRRHVNVATAFVVRRMGRRLRNASVVVIDDVMTTGATLDACSRVLRAAGVRRVAALTLARTASGRPPGRAQRPRPCPTRHR